MLTARQVAVELIARNYAPVPLLYKTKKPEHASWQKWIYTFDDIDTQFPDNDQQNIGVLLGIAAKPNCYLMCVDIDFHDDQQTIDRVYRALGGGQVPCKKGKKGASFFARMPDQTRKLLYKRKGEAKKVVGQIEILGFGQQTVLPPSLHPETHDEYEWLDQYGPPLQKTEVDQLPVLTPSVLDEIQLAAEKPDSPFFGLDEMVFHGPGGGGTVHDTVLAAIGVMVQRGWSRENTRDRCNKAARTILVGNPHASEWDWKIFDDTLSKMVDGAFNKGFDTPSAGAQKRRNRVDMQNDAVDLLITEFGGSERVGVIDGVFRVYADGWWREWDGDALMRRVIQAPDNWSWITTQDAKAVVSKLQYAAGTRRRTSVDVVMTRKGPVDLNTGLIIDPDPEHLLTFVLPVDYDPEAECPVYDDFVVQLFSGMEVDDDDRAKAIACFEEYCGLSFVADTRYQKAVILEGPPQAGKSTILKVVEAMHDSSSRVSLDLFNLRSERVIGSLVGRMVAFTFEISQEEFVPADIFKQLADGSTMPVRRLYAEISDVPMTARMIIACNEMFKYRDSSGAMERRMLLLRTRAKVEDSKVRLNLLQELISETPGIFNRFVAALTRLRQRTRFDPPSYMVASLDSASEASDIVLRWLRERTFEGMRQLDPGFNPSPGVDLTLGTASSELYGDFKDYADQHGHKTMSDVTWGARVSKRGFEAKTKRTPSGVHRVRMLTLSKRGGY